MQETPAKLQSLESPNQRVSLRPVPLGRLLTAPRAALSRVPATSPGSLRWSANSFPQPLLPCTTPTPSPNLLPLRRSLKANLATPFPDLPLNHLHQSPECPGLCVPSSTSFHATTCDGFKPLTHLPSVCSLNVPRASPSAPVYPKWSPSRRQQVESRSSFAEQHRLLVFKRPALEKTRAHHARSTRPELPLYHTCHRRTHL